MQCHPFTIVCISPGADLCAGAGAAGVRVPGFTMCVFPQVPIFVPVLVLLVSVYLVVAPIIQDPRIEFLYAALFSLSGLIFYVPFVVYQKKLKCMSE